HKPPLPHALQSSKKSSPKNSPHPVHARPAPANPPRSSSRCRFRPAQWLRSAPQADQSRNHLKQSALSPSQTGSPARRFFPRGAPILFHTQAMQLLVRRQCAKSQKFLKSPPRQVLRHSASDIPQ